MLDAGRLFETCIDLSFWLEVRNKVDTSNFFCEISRILHGQIANKPISLG